MSYQDLLSELSKEEGLSLSRYDVLRLARTLLQKNPPDVGALWWLCQILFFNGRLEEAESTLSMLLRAEPGHTNARLLRAHALGLLMSYSEAIAEYEAVLSREPDNAEAAGGLRDLREYLDALRKGKPYFGPVLLSCQDPKGERTPRLRALIEMACALWRGEEPFFVLEIGSWAGGSATLWARTIVELCRRNGRVYCVDPWREHWDLTTLREKIHRVTFKQLLEKGCLSITDEAVAHRYMNDVLKTGELFRLFLHNIKALGFEDLILPLRGANREILPLLREGLFDFIYIDGSHFYEDVRYDIEQALRLAKEDAFIVGDDLVLQLHECDREQVRRFIDERIELVQDEKTGQHYCPGVALAVAETFGEVSAWDGVWAVHKRGHQFERVTLPSETT